MPLPPGFRVPYLCSSTVWVPLAYEFIPAFCYKCGMLNHNRSNCRVPDGKASKLYSTRNRIFSSPAEERLLEQYIADHVKLIGDANQREKEMKQWILQNASSSSPAAGNGKGAANNTPINNLSLQKTAGQLDNLEKGSVISTSNIAEVSRAKHFLPGECSGTNGVKKSNLKKIARQQNSAVAKWKKVHFADDSKASSSAIGAESVKRKTNGAEPSSLPTSEEDTTELSGDTRAPKKLKSDESSIARVQEVAMQFIQEINREVGSRALKVVETDLNQSQTSK